jgi:hypothetical protein
MVIFGAMEHRHHCLYCGELWFCYEDCLLTGPSICAECATSDELSDAPRRVIGLSSKILNRLTEAEAERLRRFLRGRPEV